MLELLMLAVSVATVLSSTDFIAKAFANIAYAYKYPQYFISTVVISFIFTFPALLITFVANYNDYPMFGTSFIVAFVLTVLTFVLGIFLLSNKVPIEYERYRNSTFLWAAAIVFLIVSQDALIDRMDALFLIAIFVFYSLYIFYRTKISKEYIYYKTKTSNKILMPIAILAIIIGSYAMAGSSTVTIKNFPITTEMMSMGLALLLSLPIFDIIRATFKDARVTFDNIIGTGIIALTLVPAIPSLILPMPYWTPSGLQIIPVLFIVFVCLLISILVKSLKSIGKKTGILLLLIYIISITSYFLFL